MSEAPAPSGESEIFEPEAGEVEPSDVLDEQVAFDINDLSLIHI